MNAHENAVTLYAANSRRILSLSLIALLGVVAPSTGPASAADGIHCIHTIDYNKLSASELEMLYRDIDVTQFANKSATGGKCVITIDYNKLSPEELEMRYRDIDMHHYARGSAVDGKNVATIDYNKLSSEELDRVNKGIDTVVAGAGAGKEKSMTVFGK